MSRALRATLVVVLVVVLLAAGAGGLVWWKLSHFKAQLLADVGRELGADVQVASIDLDVFKGELHIAGISLTNQRPDQPWDKGGIAQATVRYHLADLLAPTMPVTVEVTSWSVVLHSPLRTAETPPAASADPGAETGTGGTSHRGRIRVTHLAATDGTVEFDFSDDRRVTMRGVAFDAADNGAGVWTTQVQASSIKSPTLDLGASSVQIRGDANTITFTDLRLQCPPGAITGDGDVATASPHDMHLNLKAVDLPMAMLVSVGWQQELAGLVTLDVHYTGNDQGGGAQGSLSVAHGKFSVLPWLGKVTSLVGLQDITGVEVDKATTDFQWQNGTLLLTHLDVRKNDVARIAGKVDISPQNQVDGRLRLGLPSLVTAKWPQLQAAVFPVQEDGCNWADVHLTGTPDHLQEDLTPRLVAASLGQGSDMLNQGMKKAGTLLNGILGK